MKQRKLMPFFAGAVVFLLLGFGNAVMAAPINVALSGTATQSSLAYGGVASRAIDGNTDGSWYHDSVTHTNAESQAWWRVDLGSPYLISEIHIWNRTDCCSNRLSNFRVSVLDAALGVVWSQDYYTAGGYPAPDLDITSVGVTGQYVKVQLLGTNYLSLAEVQVYSDTSAVPEPATAGLLGLGLAGLAISRLRRRR